MIVNWCILKINGHHYDYILERDRQRILPSLQCVWREPQLVLKCKHKVLFENGRDFCEKGWWLQGIKQDAWYGLMLLCVQWEWTYKTRGSVQQKPELGSCSSCAVLAWSQARPEAAGGTWDKKHSHLGKRVLSVFRSEFASKLHFHWQVCPVKAWAQNESFGWYLPAES